MENNTYSIGQLARIGAEKEVYMSDVGWRIVRTCIMNK